MEMFARKVGDVFPPKHLVNEEVWNHKCFELKGENHLYEVKDTV